MGGSQTVSDYVSVLKNRTIRVVIIEESPFIMFKRDHYNKSHVKPTDVEGMLFDTISQTLWNDRKIHQFAMAWNKALFVLQQEILFTIKQTFCNDT